MKAWVYEEYGRPDDVLELREVPVPEISADQVLVRVEAASVNPLDWHLMTGTPRVARLTFGLRRPKRNIPGADVAGVVEKVGANVTRFQPGDAVFGETIASLAEHVAVSEKGLVAKPDNITFEEVAAVPVAGLTALQGLRDWGGLEPGEKVLINGASGGVGTYALQVASALGASSITAVCSTRNVELARALGADRVIDYTKDDFTRSDDRYDLVFDGPVNRSVSDLRSILAPGAVHVFIGGPKGAWIQPLPVVAKLRIASMFFDFEAAGGTAQRELADLETLGAWLESGTVRSVIDRNYKFDEVPEAIAYQGEFHARGKIVVTL